jgi:hypothetical protein
MGAGGICNYSVTTGPVASQQTPPNSLEKKKHLSPAMRRPWRTAVCLWGKRFLKLLYNKWYKHLLEKYFLK